MGDDRDRLAIMDLISKAKPFRFVCTASAKDESLLQCEIIDSFGSDIVTYRKNHTVYSVGPAKSALGLNGRLEYFHYASRRMPTLETLANDLRCAAQRRLHVQPWESRNLLFRHFGPTSGSDYNSRLSDELGNIQGILAPEGTHKIRSGEHLFRFCSSTTQAPYRWASPYWTSAREFAMILGRTGENQRGRGVQGGDGLSLRDYARVFSAVIRDWSALDLLVVGQALCDIKCYKTLGSKVHVTTDLRGHRTVHFETMKQIGMRQVKKSNDFGVFSASEHQPVNIVESYEDYNYQLYIPHLSGKVDRTSSGKAIQVLMEYEVDHLDQRISAEVQATKQRQGHLSTRFIMGLLQSQADHDLHWLA